MLLWTGGARCWRSTDSHNGYVRQASWGQIKTSYCKLLIPSRLALHYVIFIYLFIFQFFSFDSHSFFVFPTRIQVCSSKVDVGSMSSKNVDFAVRIRTTSTSGSVLLYTFFFFILLGS